MSRKRKIGLSFLGLFLLVAVALVLLFLHWMSTSSEGTVHTGTPTANSPAAPTQPLAIQTSYFSTSLPAGFSLKRQNETPNSDPQLQLMATTPSITDQQFAASYAALPVGGITEVASYHLRVVKSGDYAQFTPPNLPADAVAFQNITGPPGFAVFWPHGNHYVSIALSTDGGADLDQLEATFSQAISGWKWLQ